MKTVIPIVNEILLIDDNNFINFLNKNTLAELGVAKNIHTATDGFEALNYLKECQKQECFPDLILLDVIMPYVDGTDFVKWVEMLQLKSSTTKIVALTGGGNDSRFAELENLGLDGILYKPLKKYEFMMLFEKLFCE